MRFIFVWIRGADSGILWSLFVIINTNNLFVSVNEVLHTCSSSTTPTTPDSYCSSPGDLPSHNVNKNNNNNINKKSDTFSGFDNRHKPTTSGRSNRHHLGRNMSESDVSSSQVKRRQSQLMSVLGRMKMVGSEDIQNNNFVPPSLAEVSVHPLPLCSYMAVISIKIATPTYHFDSAIK